jgi:hypothetical protein
MYPNYYSNSTGGTTGTYTIPNGCTKIWYLLIGGGGNKGNGGGSYRGGDGGAGGLNYGNISMTDNTSFSSKSITSLSYSVGTTTNNVNSSISLTYNLSNIINVVSGTGGDGSNAKYAFGSYVANGSDGSSGTNTISNTGTIFSNLNTSKTSVYNNNICPYYYDTPKPTNYPLQPQNTTSGFGMGGSMIQNMTHGYIQVWFIF